MAGLNELLSAFANIWGAGGAGQLQYNHDDTLGAGTHDIWTPTAGKRCIMLAFSITIPTTGTSAYLQVESGDQLTADIPGHNNWVFPVFHIWPADAAVLNKKIQLVVTGAAGAAISMWGFEADGSV
jgi:hypothetical protein